MSHPLPSCDTLQVSTELQKALEAFGTRESFSAREVLFREDGDNSGVFLVLSGELRLSVSGSSNLDRSFTAGSLLGLPSTFTGQLYSLTATAIVDSEVVHASKENFLRLMRERLDLCCEATAILSREVIFIHSAVAERRRSMASRKPAFSEAVLVS
jgi:CRP-like cAMP-binding protein